MMVDSSGDYYVKIACRKPCTLVHGWMQSWASKKLTNHALKCVVKLESFFDLIVKFINLFDLLFMWRIEITPAN